MKRYSVCAIAALLLGSSCMTPTTLTPSPDTRLGDSVVGQDCDRPAGICRSATDGSFPLILGGQAAVIVADEGLEQPVLTAIEAVRKDLAAIATDDRPDAARSIRVGTTSSPHIRALIESGDLNVDSLEGQWEAYLQTVVMGGDNGDEPQLVIVGSDARGAIYGLYDLSERIGVSAWHWWADVPVIKQADLFIAPGANMDKPDVKYRGIFLNDENPALYGWVHENYEDGFGDGFYERVFELILRHKGNYIWPAMWGKAYYDDDPDNVKLARDMGVIVGTSHHEPLGRAHVEWERYGDGPWDYDRNPETLLEFWRGGMDRMKDNEVLVTVGMRGDGDEAMSEDTAIELLETIVADQRDIIADVTGKPASETPQLWALYKEVQDYFDQGMDVPDDVMLLFADDNWGNIRRLPKAGETRPGGYGVYYHFDYVGGPRNHKWLNTTQIERVWEQMHLAREYGADRLWIVNVGDLKPMEFPISYFLDMAWDPESQTAANIPDYYADWSAKQFGTTHAEAIGDLIKGYTRLNSRRKPELIAPGTFSLSHYNEAERISAEWRALEAKADKTRAALNPQFHDAYDQLVWWPIMASSNLNHLYIAAEKNRLYAAQERQSANVWADEVDRLFARDAELTDYYHRQIADGKWNHFASQTHIGYRYWQQPEHNNKPVTKRVIVPEVGHLGISAAGTEAVSTPDAPMITSARLDTVHSDGGEITLFNTGQSPINWSANSNSSGLILADTDGVLENEAILKFTLDPAALPAGRSQAVITVLTQNGVSHTVNVPLSNPQVDAAWEGALPRGGIISVNAQDFASANGEDVTWTVIDSLSRSGSGVIALPVTAPASDPYAAEAPYLEYKVILERAGTYRLNTTIAPNLDVAGKGGIQFAASVGSQAPQVKTIDLQPDTEAWNAAVTRNSVTLETVFTATNAGPQTVRLWRMDPGVVFQKITISEGPLAPSELGPEPSLTAADVR